jgi:hypothetical protein
MPRIRCRYIDCVFLEENFCGAAAIELDPDTGCLTYSQTGESESDDKWDEEEFDEDWEEDEEEEGFEIEDEEDEGNWEEGD